MKVTFSSTHSAFSVKAPAGTLVSLTGTPTEVVDGVYTIGDDGCINIDDQMLTDSIYLSVTGEDYEVAKGARVAYPKGADGGVVVRAGSDVNPFKTGGKGGGGSSGGGCTYRGTTTTAISNGSTTNPIIIDGESYTAVFGDVVVYGYTEFVFDGTQWSEFGRPFDTEPTSGSTNAVTSDGIYKRTPFARGSADNSAQFGELSTAEGRNSIAAGYNARATGLRTSAFGYGTKANESNMTAVGKYNSPRTGDLFNVGNGSGINNRSNILEVSETDVNVNGDIKRDGVGIDDYTTTERKIGKWIDGSDLYQRTFEVTGLTENNQWVFNNNILGTSNINIKDFKGYTEWSDGTNTTRFDLNFYLSNGIHSLCLNSTSDLAISLNHESSSLVKAVITIKYTKPSVQANIQQTEEPTDEMR